MNKVSIIIVNYNTENLLKNCIDSIYKYCINDNYEIIVVDNASKDNTVKMIEEEYKDVVLIKNNQNLGFGKANNIGVNNANFEYILLLNSDTIVESNIVNEFLEYYNNNNNDDNNIGCLGAWLYDKQYKINNSFGHFPTMKEVTYDLLKLIFRFNKPSYNNQFNIETEKKNGIKNVDYVVGALMFMKKKTFKELNGFDEEFFMYYEETELQHRMMISGMSRIIIDTPKVIHLEGKSPNQSNFKRIMYTDSMYKYFKKTTNNIFKFYMFKYITLILRLPTFMSKKYTFRENLQFYKFMLGNRINN